MEHRRVVVLGWIACVLGIAMCATPTLAQTQSLDCTRGRGPTFSGKDSGHDLGVMGLLGLSRRGLSGWAGAATTCRCASPRIVNIRVLHSRGGVKGWTVLPVQAVGGGPLALPVVGTGNSARTPFDVSLAPLLHKAGGLHEGDTLLVRVTARCRHGFTIVDTTTYRVR